MQREYFLNAVAGLSVVAMVAAVSPRLIAQEVEKEIRRIVVKVDAGGDDDATKDGDAKDGGELAGDEQKFRESADRIAVTFHASPYWIGAECTEADQTLRTQLNLDKGRGLVVQDVVADSPAAKAGLKKYDVIVSLGEQPVGKASELVKAVDAAKEGELKLGILRGGKSETIAVKPEERKLSGQKIFIHDHAPLDVQMLRPGMVLPQGAKFNIKIQPFRAELPADMTVTITKTGKTPAKIVIKQGDKSWETTADCLEDLPDDMRKQIEPMMMALPFPHGDRDVIFLPNTKEIHERAARGVREAEQIRVLATEAAARAREEFQRLQKQSEELRESAQKATGEKAKELRAAADKLRRAAGQVMEEAGQAFRERDFAIKKLDDAQKEIKSEASLKTVQDLIERRFNELQKEIDGLRKNVEQLKSDSKKE